MADRGRGDGNPRAAHHPQLRCDVTDVVGFDPCGVLDLGYMPGPFPRFENIDPHQHALMRKRCLEDRLVPAVIEQLAGFLRRTAQSAFLRYHHAIGTKPACEIADAVPVGKGHTDPRALTGQHRAMDRKPQPLRALLEQRDPRFGKTEGATHKVEVTRLSPAAASGDAGR